jgi:uncharacterized protein YoxC
MVKASDDKAAPKGAYMCSSCKHEFEGSSCPECGNGKGNIRLAQDGIEHEFHKSSYLFNANKLKPAEDYLSDSNALERKRIQMQMEELDDNLREAQVIRTKIKMQEQQMALKKKEIEAKQLEESAADYLSGKSSHPPLPGQQQDQSSQYPNIPFMSTMSPQAVFMQQLMKMDSKKRAEFIDQLSEADPGALSNLSSMFQQSQPQSPYPQMNPYQPNQFGQYPMMPPWMIQQQPPQPQQPHTDPIALITAVFELTQKMQPQRDDSIKETLQEFKNSIQKVHDRIDVITTKEKEHNMNPLLDKINNIEQQIKSGSGSKSVVDQVNELTALVEGLEKAGLVKRSGSADKTVDDELKLKEFDFKREIENRKIEIEENKMEAEKSKSNLTQSIVSSLLQRGIQKGLQAREEEEHPKKSVPMFRQPAIMNRVRTSSPPVQTIQSEPQEVINEVTTESGVVRETRRPVKKINFGEE